MHVFFTLATIIAHTHQCPQLTAHHKGLLRGGRRRPLLGGDRARGAESGHGPAEPGNNQPNKFVRYESVILSWVVVPKPTRER